MRRLLALAVSPFLLAGCVMAPAADVSEGVETIPEISNSAEPSPTHTPSPTPSEEEPVDTGPAISARGFLLKEIGEEAGFGPQHSDAPVVTFTVTDIVRDFRCTDEYAMGPGNGEYIGLHFDVEVTTDYASAGFGPGNFAMFESDFQGFTVDGKRVNDIVGNAYSCLAMSDALPFDLGPGQTASGWMAFDVPSETAIIAYTLEGSGWEWQLP